MKKIAYMILAAALACSCQIDDGRDSRRNEYRLKKFAQEMMWTFIYHPAFVVNNIIDSGKEDEGIADKISDKVWEFDIREVPDCKTRVEYIGKDEQGNDIFNVSTNGTVSNKYYRGETTRIHKALMTLAPDAVILIEPGEFRSTDGVKGEGLITIDIYRDNEKVDFVEIHIGKDGSMMTSSLDEAYYE